MNSHFFTHENELLSAAPLNAENDHELFAKQSFSLMGCGKLQYDFILHNGKDVHFREAFENVRDDERLNAFKNYIRRVLEEYARS